jgi:hypothetical protein
LSTVFAISRDCQVGSFAADESNHAGVIAISWYAVHDEKRQLSVDMDAPSIWERTAHGLTIHQSLTYPRDKAVADNSLRFRHNSPGVDEQMLPVPRRCGCHQRRELIPEVILRGVTLPSLGASGGVLVP